jgi:integrase
MSTVSAYTTKSGPRWRVRYRTSDGQSTGRRGFATRRDAQLFAATLVVRKAAGDVLPASAGEVTVGHLAPLWLRRKQRSAAPSHFRTLEWAWRTHVAPVWKQRRVADVTTLDVETWIAEMSEAGAGSTTIRRAHSVLAGIFNDAIKDRRLTRNAVSAVENLPRRIVRRHRYLTADEVHRLSESAGEHRVLVLVLAFCGLRWSEAIALRVSDIDIPRSRITVSSSAVELGGRHVVGPTKTRKPRVVPVPSFVTAELNKRCDGKALEELVFPSRSGSYLLRPHSSDGWFAGALRRASLDRMTIHDPRHTCASLSVSAGANVLALQRILGHTSAKLRLDVYAVLFDTDLDKLSVSLDMAYAPASTSAA